MKLFSTPIANQARLAEGTSVDSDVMCGILAFVSIPYALRGLLHLTYFPDLLHLRGLLDSDGSCQPDPRHLLDTLGIALLMVIFAYVAAEFNEAGAASVARRLRESWMLRTKEIAR